jgi:hypothetical protein
MYLRYEGGEKLVTIYRTKPFYELLKKEKMVGVNDWVLYCHIRVECTGKEVSSEVVSHLGKCQGTPAPNPAVELTVETTGRKILCASLEFALCLLCLS